MQCKDIPTRPILEFLLKHEGNWCFNFSKETSERSIFFAMPDNTPFKLCHAKMRKLIFKGLVDGCPCGCRGDYGITDKGKRTLLSLAGPIHGSIRKKPHPVSSTHLKTAPPIPDKLLQLVHF